ncbi:MAG: hypothetical protein ACM3XO_06520, partial [Bacteroidota bacterium]
MRTLRYKLPVTLIVLAFLLSLTRPAAADGGINVYYEGREGSVKTALELAEYDLVQDPAQADVFVFDGSIPNDPATAARAQAGEAGMVLFLGPDMTAPGVSNLLGFPVELNQHKDPASLTALNIDDPMVTQIPWNG